MIFILNKFVSVIICSIFVLSARQIKKRIMKAVNQLSEIFKETGYYSDFNNRSFDVKALNKAMAAGLRIQLCEKGKVYVPASGVKWNVRLSVGGKGFTYKFKTEVSPYTILNALAKLIQEDKFNLKSGTDYKMAEPCSKCSGRGIIPYFSFYCNGICFDCMGLGYKGEYTTVKI
jgi:hypothetical protein